MYIKDEVDLCKILSEEQVIKELVHLYHYNISTTIVGQTRQPSRETMVKMSDTRTFPWELSQRPTRVGKIMHMGIHRDLEWFSLVFDLPQGTKEGIAGLI